MITQELINYIRLQKQQGISNETIRGNLLNSNWSEQDINQALLQTSTLQPTQSQTPLFPSSTPSSQPQVFTQQVDSTFTGEEEKPKIFKVFSALFLFIAFLYGFSTVMMTGVMLIINRAETNAGGPDFNFLKYFPSIGLIPLIILFATILFIFVGLKILDGSRSSWWLGVFSLIVIPIPLPFVIVMILSNSFSSIQSLITGQEENIVRPSFNFQTLGQFIYAFAIFEIVLLLLLIFIKKFHFESRSLSKKAKIFITIVFIVFVLPVISVMGYGYYKTTDTDYEYTKVKSEVNYHVYKSEFIPGGRVNGTVFIPNKELAGLQNAIQVAYATPLDKTLKEETLSIIVMKQVGVNQGFDLRSFTSSLTKDPTSIEQISLSLAANQNAYLIQKTSGKLELKILTFITPDNVLITITTPKATKEELIQLAESLK